jgi:hypothetical protein
MSAYVTSGKISVKTYPDPGTGDTVIITFKRSDKTYFRATFTTDPAMDKKKTQTLTGELYDDPFSVTGSMMLNPSWTEA